MTTPISETILTGPSLMERVYICNFIANLDGHSKVLLFLRELALPFNNETNVPINRVISSAVDKIPKLSNERLHELDNHS